jgi:hypothetical protein
MKLVHIFVALALALGSAHADATDTTSTISEFESMAIRFTTGATAAGGEAGVAVQGVLAALEKQPAVPANESHDALGWRMGYADARAGVYHDHTPAKADAKAADFHRGYEEGWAAGSSDTGY